MQPLSVVQSYILKAILHHRVVTRLGESGTVWGGMDFTRDVSVLSDEHDVLHDLYDALEDWLLDALQRGEPVRVIDGVDLTTQDSRSIGVSRQAHRHEIDPDQAWFWTPEWQVGEQEASREIRAGQDAMYRSGEELLAAFDDEDEIG